MLLLASATHIGSPSVPYLANEAATLPTGDTILRQNDLPTPPTDAQGERSEHESIDLASPLPSPSRQTSGFGMRIDPIGARYRLHAGLDLAAPAGTPVFAVAAGNVRFASAAGGYGNLVVLEHGGGLATRYAHLLRPLVHAGDKVVAGQIVGLVGESGHATGYHLHFEVLVNGIPIDPNHVNQQSRLPNTIDVATVESTTGWADHGLGPHIPSPVAN